MYISCQSKKIPEYWSVKYFCAVGVLSCFVRISLYTFLETALSTLTQSFFQRIWIWSFETKAFPLFGQQDNKEFRHCIGRVSNLVPRAFLRRGEDGPSHPLLGEEKPRERGCRASRVYISWKIPEEWERALGTRLQGVKSLHQLKHSRGVKVDSFRFSLTITSFLSLTRSSSVTMPFLNKRKWKDDFLSTKISLLFHIIMFSLFLLPKFKMYSGLAVFTFLHAG